MAIIEVHLVYIVAMMFAPANGLNSTIKLDDFPTESRATSTVMNLSMS